MRFFDTKIQHLKYQVLREVARQAWADKLPEAAFDIPKTIIPGKVPTMRCCVYKERAILGERVRIAMGYGEDEDIIEVIDIACDECPSAGYEVTEFCRGCLAHRCEDVCKKNAITFDADHRAHIDKEKCVNCGACAKVCPYFAIANRKRPCLDACKIKAITINEDNVVAVDRKKCVSCGACVYRCPFGAITDRSYILRTIDLLRGKGREPESRVYAIIAPAFASQFRYAKPGQVVAGLKKIGFDRVVETALGADLVAREESRELAEKGFLISSCCPSFVAYVEKNFPALAPDLSKTLSPMAALAKYIKENDVGARVVFIGPCTAKKEEAKKPAVRPYVDAVLTFEELQALFDSRDLEIDSLDPCGIDDASRFGRIFAGSGGLTQAVSEGLRELGDGSFSLRPCVCNGIEECKLALLKKSKNLLNANFIEGMACVGGCVGGAGCLTHSERNCDEINRFGDLVADRTIIEATENANHIFKEKTED